MIILTAAGIDAFFFLCPDYYVNVFTASRGYQTLRVLQYHTSCFIRKLCSSWQRQRVRGKSRRAYTIIGPTVKYDNNIVAELQPVSPRRYFTIYRLDQIIISMYKNKNVGWKSVSYQKPPVVVMIGEILLVETVCVDKKKKKIKIHFTAKRFYTEEWFFFTKNSFHSESKRRVLEGLKIIPTK